MARREARWNGPFHDLSRLEGMATILTLCIPLTFVLMLIVERAFPARPLAPVRRWLFTGIAFFVVSGVINAVVPALLANALEAHAPLHLTRALGTGAAGIAGFLAGDLVAYGVHRLLHSTPLLWRWVHQLHHSAERVDIAGGAFFHPLDIAVQVGATSITVILLGLSPDAAALAGFIAFFAGMFQHLNVRTPQWLGWIIQRPEAHAIHHARGVHAYNYGNVMLWDMAFGTFRNPATFTEPAGFWDGASSKIGAMLVGRDVSEPPH